MAKAASTRIKKDLGQYKAINAFVLSEGGKHLRDACLKDILSVIDMIAYTSKPLKLEEYISLAAKVHEKLSMYRVLINSRRNVTLTEEALKEALEQEAEE